MEEIHIKRLIKFCEDGVSLATERCVDRNTDERERLASAGEVSAYRAVLSFLRGEGTIDIGDDGDE